MTAGTATGQGPGCVFACYRTAGNRVTTAVKLPAPCRCALMTNHDLAPATDDGNRQVVRMQNQG